MRQILIAVGGLLIIGGMLGATYTVGTSNRINAVTLGYDPTSAYVIAAIYLLSGLISSVIFFALAVILSKLEALEAKH